MPKLQITKPPKEATKAAGKCESEERGQWANPVEFILSCLGYAVGLGNVWRFPYLTFSNGGGAFLIPYFIMLTFVGIPVFLIELAIGQYSASGPATVWEVSPLFKGVGVGMLVISFISSIYYNMIIAWSLYYLFATFQSVLPWQGCNNDFNTEYCYSKREAEPCELDLNGTWFNNTCYNATYISSMNTPTVFCNTTQPNNTWVDLNDTWTAGNATCLNTTYNPLVEWLTNLTAKAVTPSEEYFNYKMLDRSGAIDDHGYVKWDLCLCLLLAWIICFLCILKGIKSAGKVVYFTATFPFLLLFILFFRAVILNGAGLGVSFYIIPDWSHLKNPKVWADAAGQIFFSLSVGTGGLMTFASYNKFHNNVYRDTLIVSIGNCMTSFFSGFVIFSILGFMATELGVEVKDVADSGSGLAFIAYPEIVTRLPLPQLWSFLFFFMLLTLGLDSQFASLENIQTAITDVWPQTRRYKVFVAASLCISMFLLGFTQLTRAGLYWSELMNHYSSGWSLVVMGLIEVIIFPWVYGADRMLDDIEAMCGFRLWRHWWFCWKFITPAILVLVLVFNFIYFTPLAVGSYIIPGWAQGLGWMMALVSVFMIPVFAVIVFWQSFSNPDYDGLSLGRRFIQLCRPSKKWRPASEMEVKREIEMSESTMEAPPSYISDFKNTPESTEYYNKAAYISQSDISHL